MNQNTLNEHAEGVKSEYRYDMSKYMCVNNSTFIESLFFDNLI